MGTKSFFTKQKSQDSSIRGQEKSTIQGLTSSIESVDYIKQHTIDKETFLPEFDFSDPAKFVKYGSAKDYYTDLVSRVTQSYPYDGSLAERLKFKNELVGIQRYELDNNYPKSTGYADFSDDYYAGTLNKFAVGGILFSLGDATLGTDNYIITDNYSKDLIYDTSSSQIGAIELDFGKGTTVEFWMKKDTFPDPAETQNEVIFSISNREQDLFHVVTDVTASSTIIASFSKLLTHDQFIYQFNTGLTSIADEKWHHYALTFSTSSAGFTGEIYVDGVFQEKKHYAKSSAARYRYITGSTIDATVAASSISSYLGDGKLMGYLDEVRLWKTRRDAREIGSNYFFDVGGGGNTDNTKVNKKSPLDLTLYYKFNEGITGTSSIDNIVLDYSGRLADGIWIGYNESNTSRNTGSAITLSGLTTEPGNPIIYGSHPDVVSYKAEKETSGSAYDATNLSSMYDMLPQWISDEDSENGLLIRKLVQIMASYLDTLHAQISAISELQDGRYVSGSSAKPNPFSKRNLTSYGFDIPDVFVDSGVIEEIYFKDEKRLYQDKLFNLKNLIFQNIFNNLNFLNKTKGTEKSFRNLFRCFGVDNELVRLNMYADNQQYEFREGYETAQSKRNIVNLSGYNGLQNRNAVIYTFTDTTTGVPASETGDTGYVPSASSLYTPLTVENQIYFPKFVNYPNEKLTRLNVSSLFGMHSASSDTEETTIPTGDLYFKVYAETNLNNKTKFVLESNIEDVGTLSSSFYEGVYNNNPWTFAVKVKPREYPFSNEVTSSNVFDFEFYGVNYSSGLKVHEFSSSVEATIRPTANDIGTFLTGSNKRLYLGADRTNITGTVAHKSDTKLLSSRVWFDYLQNTELQAHAKDIRVFGRTNPYQNSFVFEGSLSASYIPRIETLALHWNFENITGSDESGQFEIQDITSGSSATLNNKYAAGDYYNLSGRNYSGKGFGFSTSSTDVVDFLFVDTAQQQLPENLYNSELIEIRDSDDVIFTRESRPSKYYFAVETSLYDTISRNILGFFASIEDFNNLVGEPVNMYRPNYKSMEKLRGLFFENIQNDPDLDKYVNLYKWIDGALDSVISNMIPASSKVSDKVRTVIENHLLERNKYRHKYLHAKQIIKDEAPKTKTHGYTPDFKGVVPTLTPKDFPQPTLDSLDGAPLFGAITVENIVPVEIQKRKKEIKEAGLRPGQSEKTPFGTRDVLAPLAQSTADQREAQAWWRLRAERNPGSSSPAGILSLGNAGADRTRVVLQINQHLNASSSVSSPVVVYGGAQRPLGTNEGYSGENRKNYFAGTFKPGTVTTTHEGLAISMSAMPHNERGRGQPYYDYSGAIDVTYGDNKRFPIQITDTTHNIELPDQRYIPFDLLSASAPPNSKYQEKLFAQEISASIETAHRDFVVEGTTLQTPFTEEHVGGWMYRHGNLFVTGPVDRKEGYALNVEANKITINNPRLFHGDFQKDVPIGYYLRERVAKSPVNVKNISGSTFFHDYEVVQSTGRRENNRYYVSSSGDTGSINTAIGSIVYDIPPGTTYKYKDYTTLDRTSTGSNNYIFVNKFSAPGGPEVEAFSFLDVQAAEYSPYNNLNYRNLIVRLANRDLLTRHALTGGFDSVRLEPTPAFYKPQRNGVYHITASDAERPDPIWDNSYISHGIPRTDVQYSWVRDSWIFQKTGYPNNKILETNLLTASVHRQLNLKDVSSSAYSPIYGFQYSDNITYLTSSDMTYLENDIGRAAFNGINFIIRGDVDINRNLFVSSSDGAAIIEGDYFFFPETTAASIPYILNAFLLNEGGPYRHASFKQTRTGDHRVARVLRNKNIYRTQLNILSPDRKRRERHGAQYSITQSSITPKFKPILQNTDETTGTLKYSFGNNYDYFAKTYSTEDNTIEDYNIELGAPKNDIYESDFYRFSKKYETVRYSEIVYPKEENVYRQLIRNRENYISFWNSDTLSDRTSSTIVNSQGVTIDASRWLLDVSLSGSSLGYQPEKSGELMRRTGSLGFNSQIEDEKNARYAFNLGLCRPNNLVQSQAGKSAFYTSYENFSSDVRLMGQDESIIPEFTISDFVETVVTTHNGDYGEKSVYNFNLTGSRELETTASFLEVYARSETLTYLNELKRFYGEPTAIRIQFDVTKKLLPKEGFYPSQRTKHLAQHFSSSHENSTILVSGVPSPNPQGDDPTYETTLMPFWAPGVGYNSIKAGFAVEFPYKTSLSGQPTGAFNIAFDSVAPFESILAPSEYVGEIHHIHDSGSSVYAYTEYSTNLNSTGSVNKSDGVYELAAHNFFAEVPEFFLEGLSTFKSSPEKTWQFEGPITSSAGVKKYAMNIVIEHPADYIQYGGPESFGPFPYNNHAPPGHYCNLVGSPGPGCPNYTNIAGLSPGVGRVSKTTATLIFDPTDLLATSFKSGLSRFSLDDIIANSTIEHSHEIGFTVFMTATSSMDLFNRDDEGRWVIKSKWECPTMQFSGTVATGMGAPTNAPLTYTRGMWHQYGSLAGSNDRSRVHVRLEETAYEDSTMTGSLLDAAGFAPEAKAFGKIRNQKILEEAVCAIPYYVDCETKEEKFFEMPINIFENRYSRVRRNEITEDSVSDMIRKMDKYVVPPPYDFVHVRDKSRKMLTTKADFGVIHAPFSMYFFEFSSKLTQQDLADIWQGVMPTIATTAEKETVVLEHPLVDGELLSPSIFGYNGFSSVPKDIRWKIFKVKKRASNDYYKMVQGQTGVPTYKRSNADRFSFNWPYDYFSLVELGKMEVGFEALNDSPDRIRDIRGGGYISPEEVVRETTNLGTPLTISKESEDYSATEDVYSDSLVCTDGEARELQLLISKSQTQMSVLGGPTAGTLTARESSRLQKLLRKCPRPKSTTPTLPLIDIGLLSDLTIPEREPSARICDDRTALNYNGPAPCRYEAADRLVDVPGCNDPTALNYDPGATINDGSCEYLTCDDPVASNFGQKGECKYEVVRGCMDPDAVNYNPNATEDDPSQCLYEGASGLPQGYSPDDAGMGNESVL